MALDTQVTIAGAGGIRTTPLSAFIVDAYTTELGANEMVTEVSVAIPRQPGGGAYVKFEKRAGDFAVASVGVQLELDERERCRAVAVTLGALGPTPLRALGAEALLQGRNATDDRLGDAARLVREAAQPFDDTRGSAAYKRHLAGVLFRRAFAAAMDRARGRHVATLHM